MRDVCGGGSLSSAALVVYDSYDDARRIFGHNGTLLVDVQKHSRHIF
jgi:hypothetical protein